MDINDDGLVNTTDFTEACDRILHPLLPPPAGHDAASAPAAPAAVASTSSADPASAIDPLCLHLARSWQRASAPRRHLLDHDGDGHLDRDDFLPAPAGEPANAYGP